MLFIIMFLLWIVISGGVSVYICTLGIIISAFITWFSVKFLDYSPLRIDRFFIRLFKGALYMLYLFKEIIMANLAVIKIIYSRKEPEPRLVHFKSDLKDSEGLQVLVANSITLTPGTITVDVNDGEYTVHGLDVSMTDGIEECGFFQQAEKLRD